MKQKVVVAIGKNEIHLLKTRVNAGDCCKLATKRTILG
jgi:hypothetical protein